MNDEEYLYHRLGFLEGTIEGIRLYAIWHNGEQLVGCLGRPLKEVLAPLLEEQTKIQTAIAQRKTALHLAEQLRTKTDFSPN